jgi:beta-xylosidase
MAAKKKIIITVFTILLLQSTNRHSICAQTGIEKTYTNPIINEDFSDPDVIRAGDWFYMTSSSFTSVPGLPILRSSNLVDWQLLGYALKNNLPAAYYKKVQHGAGAWAPSIRYHNGEFYIYYPDPDFGIYVTKTKDIMGDWTEPQLVLAGKGLIDPCPLWDEQGKVYLVHAYAGSRAGIKSVLAMKELNTAGTKVVEDGKLVYDGHLKIPKKVKAAAIKLAADAISGGSPASTLFTQPMVRRNAHLKARAL